MTNGSLITGINFIIDLVKRAKKKGRNRRKEIGPFEKQIACCLMVEYTIFHLCSSTFNEKMQLFLIFFKI